MAFLDYTGLASFWNKVKSILASKQDAITAGEGVFIENDTISLQEPVKEVNQAQYRALSEEQKSKGLYVITDANINLNDRGDVYFNEETRIGTWIDGKPIYRKVVQCPALTAVSQWYAVPNTDKLNIDVIIRMSGLLKLSTGFSYIVPITDNSLHFMLLYNPEKLVYALTNNSEWLNTPLPIILEYTKLTDTASVTSHLNTQSLSVNSFNSASQSSEKVATSQVPLPSYVTVASASASASSANFVFAPSSASSTNFRL